MMNVTKAEGRVRRRMRDAALLSATMLATCALPAQAAKFGVVVNPVADPLLAGLAIPDTAPTMGMWSGLKDWPMNAIALGLLPSGKVVSFGTPLGNPGTQDGRTFDIWDPYKGFAQGGHTTLGGVVGINSFCAAQAFRPDGSLLISGGIFDNGNDKGSVVLDSTGSKVTAIAARTAADRYYSTMLTLPNGQQIIMGGSYPYLGGWADPQGSIDKGYMTGMTPEVYDGANWRSLFGAKSRDAFGPDNNRWWYPRAWIAPNGKVFGITSEKMWYLDPAGNGAVTAMNFKEPQRNASSALDAPNVGPVSTAAMYDTGKILQVGGNSYDNGSGFLSSSRATTIDINGGTPAVADTAPMSVGRAWANATVLPSGQVAVTGGSKFNDRGDGDTVLQSEIWDPKTGRWSVGASGAVYRGYHSTAILLQNGALLLAGGGAPGPVNNQNAEAYYPPYLFTSVNGKAALAPRPQIVSLSTVQVQHGQNLQFELTSQNGLAQVVLVGLSQTTHSFNATQRRHAVAFTQADTTVSVQAPASGNIAPPGYYQLVAIDQKGVPSPGVIVALGAGVAAPTQVAAPVAAAQGTGGSGGGSGGSGGGGTGGDGTGGGGTGGTGSTGGIALKAGHSGLCLAVPAGNASDGAPVTQQACTGGAEQSWTVRAANGGSALVNGASGKCLDMSLAGPVGNGTQVYQWTCHGGTNQSWVARAQGNGNAYVSAASNLCLDVYGGSTQAGAGTIVWGCHGGANQTFTSVAGASTGTLRSLQSSNFPATYVANVGGAARLITPASASDRQQSTFRQVAGLAGQGVSFMSSTASNQYLRHQNFQIWQQTSDGGDIFKRGATFNQRAALSGTCGCNSGTCASYESIDWPGYYLRHQNFTLYLAKPDGGDLFKQDASFCAAPGLQQ